MKQLFPSVFLQSLLTLMLVLMLQAPMHATEQSIHQQQAVRIAQQAHPGRVLGVRQRGATYQVKILNASGEVRVIIVDAESGKILSGR